MEFTHSVLNSAKDLLAEENETATDSLLQILDMHLHNIHWTKKDDEYAFEKLLYNVTQYRALLAQTTGHIMRKEKQLAHQKLNNAKQTTEQIIEYAKKLIVTLEKNNQEIETSLNRQNIS